MQRHVDTEYILHTLYRYTIYVPSLHVYIRTHIYECIHIVKINAAKSRLANSHFEAVAILAQGATFGSGELAAASGAAP